MTRTATGLCVASAFALVAGAGAQQQSPNAPARNDGTTTTADFEQTAASRAAGAGRVSLSGCLDRAPNGMYFLKNARLAPTAPAAGASPTPGSASTTASDPTSTAGTGGSTSGPSTGGTTAGAAGTTGTTGSTASNATSTGARGPAAEAAGAMANSSAPMTWMLRSSSDLSPHVGHQVQVTGRAMAGADAATSGAANPSAGTAAGGSPSSAAVASSTTAASNSVDVESVRMISSSCS